MEEQQDETDEQTPDRIETQEIIGNSVTLGSIILTSSKTDIVDLSNIAVQLFNFMEAHKKDAPGYT